MRTPIIARALTIVSAAIAISTGVVVTLGYFLDFVELANLRQLFVQWALLLAAVALLVGVANLLLTHVRRMGQGGVNALYSAVLIVALVVTFLFGVILGPDHPWPSWIFNHIQVPIESSLMAVLAVSLAYASARLLQRRVNLISLLFVATALVVLLGLGSTPWGEIPVVSDLIRPWLTEVPAVAGARGILLGVALGTIAAGLRVLMGVDRPYGG